MIHPNRIIGRRIVAVEQRIVQVRDDGKTAVSFESITLDDGTVLCPTTQETDFGFYVTTLHEARTTKRGGKKAP